MEDDDWTAEVGASQPGGFYGSQSQSQRAEITCSTCRGTDFYYDDNGSLLCSYCGTISSVGARIEHTEYNEGAIARKFGHVVRRRNKQRDDDDGETGTGKGDGIREDDEATKVQLRSKLLQVFQHVIALQLKAVCTQLGVSPLHPHDRSEDDKQDRNGGDGQLTIYRVVEMVWKIYIHNLRDHGIDVLKSSDHKYMQKHEKSGIPPLSLCLSLSVIYVALRWFQITILPVELIEWARSQRIPYWNSFKFVIEDLRRSTEAADAVVDDGGENIQANLFSFLNEHIAKVGSTLSFLDGISVEADLGMLRGKEKTKTYSSSSSSSSSASSFGSSGPGSGSGSGTDDVGTGTGSEPGNGSGNEIVASVQRRGSNFEYKPLDVKNQYQGGHALRLVSSCEHWNPELEQYKIRKVMHYIRKSKAKKKHLKKRRRADQQISSMQGSTTNKKNRTASITIKSERGSQSENEESPSNEKQKNTTNAASDKNQSFNFAKFFALQSLPNPDVLKQTAGKLYTMVVSIDIDNKSNTNARLSRTHLDRRGSSSLFRDLHYESSSSFIFKPIFFVRSEDGRQKRVDDEKDTPSRNIDNDEGNDSEGTPDKIPFSLPSFDLVQVVKALCAMLSLPTQTVTQTLHFMAFIYDKENSFDLAHIGYLRKKSSYVGNISLTTLAAFIILGNTYGDSIEQHQTTKGSSIAPLLKHPLWSESVVFRSASETEITQAINNKKDAAKQRKTTLSSEQRLWNVLDEQLHSIGKHAKQANTMVRELPLKKITQQETQSGLDRKAKDSTDKLAQSWTLHRLSSEMDNFPVYLRSQMAFEKAVSFSG